MFSELVPQIVERKGNGSEALGEGLAMVLRVFFFTDFILIGFFLSS